MLCIVEVNNFKNTLLNNRFFSLNFFFQECGLPVDLCEFSQNPDACKDWLEKNHPDFYTKLNNLQCNFH